MYMGRGEELPLPDIKTQNNTEIIIINTKRKHEWYWPRNRTENPETSLNMRLWCDTASYMSGERIIYKIVIENLSHYIEKNKIPTSYYKPKIKCKKLFHLKATGGGGIFFSFLTLGN